MKAEHVADLAQGHRLRAGDTYRPGGHPEKGEKRRKVVIDMRSTPGSIPSWRMPWAARQMVRVTSLAGRSVFLVRPNGVWFDALAGLDGQGYRVNVAEDILGLVVAVWKVPTNSGTQTGDIDPPPQADMVLSLRRAGDDVRRWKAKVATDGKVAHRAARARSFNPLIGKVEALAHIADLERPASIAVKDSGGIQRLLRDDVRPRQVDLWNALQALSTMDATQVSRHWLLLERRSDA